MTCGYGDGAATGCTTPTAPVPTTSIGTPVHSSPSNLPFTGGDVIALSFIAVAFLIVGGIPKLCGWMQRKGWQ